MRITKPLLIGFAILATAKFAECLLLHAKEGFLAGEDTPVWIADRPDPTKPVTYTKLEKGIVKKAVDDWKANPDSLKLRSFPIIPVEEKHSDDNYYDDEHIIERRDAEERLPANASTSSSPSSATNFEVLYPSILVVMDYAWFKTTSDDIYDPGMQLIKDRIVYALSYWNSIDIEMRNVQKPRLPLRITGIVITSNRDASPYLDLNSKWNQLPLRNSVSPMMEYWRNVSKTNEDFALGSYDIIAHMTDMTSERVGYHVMPGYSTLQVPCILKDKIGGLIVYDDLAFKGLFVTVAKMATVLGDDSASWLLYKFERKEWWKVQLKSWIEEEKRFSTTVALDEIEQSLKNGSCMAAPKEYHPPGKPLQPILASEIMPRHKQCELASYSDEAWRCRPALPEFLEYWNSGCSNLLCVMPNGLMCDSENPTLDGTFCNEEKTKVCLRDQCVDLK